MRRVVTLTLLTLGLATTAACGDASEPSDARPTVVVSFPVLASVVRDVVGDAARVQVLMPNGIDPHDWSPSAKDVAALDDADLVMVNGLGLEEGLEDALAEAERAGVAVFEATDHVTLRELGAAAIALVPASSIEASCTASRGDSVLNACIVPSCFASAANSEPKCLS